MDRWLPSGGLAAAGGGSSPARPGSSPPPPPRSRFAQNIMAHFAGSKKRFDCDNPYKSLLEDDYNQEDEDDVLSVGTENWPGEESKTTPVKEEPPSSPPVQVKEELLEPTDSFSSAATTPPPPPLGVDGFGAGVVRPPHIGVVAPHHLLQHSPPPPQQQQQQGVYERFPTAAATMLPGTAAPPIPIVHNMLERIRLSVLHHQLFLQGALQRTDVPLEFRLANFDPSSLVGPAVGLTSDYPGLPPRAAAAAAAVPSPPPPARPAGRASPLVARRPATVARDIDGQRVHDDRRNSRESPDPPPANRNMLPANNARLTKDERIAVAMGLEPGYVDVIIKMPMEEFTDFCAGRNFGEEEMSKLKDIRRRGKNKVAAQNCRKRKFDTLKDLEDQIEEEAQKKLSLFAKKKELEANKENYRNTIEKLLHTKETGLVCNNKPACPTLTIDCLLLKHVSLDTDRSFEHWITAGDNFPKAGQQP